MGLFLFFWTQFLLAADLERPRLIPAGHEFTYMTATCESGVYSDCDKWQFWSHDPRLPSFSQVPINKTLLTREALSQVILTLAESGYLREKKYGEVVKALEHLTKESASTSLSEMDANLYYFFLQAIAGRKLKPTYEWSWPDITQLPSSSDSVWGGELIVNGIHLVFSCYDIFNSRCREMLLVSVAREESGDIERFYWLTKFRQSLINFEVSYRLNNCLALFPKSKKVIQKAIVHLVDREQLGRPLIINNTDLFTCLNDF